MNIVLKLKLQLKIVKYIIILLLVILLFLPVSNYFKSLEQDRIIYGEDRNFGIEAASYIFYDKDGYKVSINSQYAQYLSKDEIKFKDLELRHNRADNKIKIKAFNALYHQQNRELDFAEGIIIRDEQELEIYAERASYAMNENQLYGSRDIILKNKFGALNSESFIINLAEQKYYFKHNIKFKFQSDSRTSELYAEALDIDNINNIINIWHDPLYLDQQLEISSKEMKIKFEQIDDKLQITELNALNKVVIKHQDKYLYGNLAIFYPQKQLIIIEGEVKIKQEKNTIKGEKIIYNLLNQEIKILQLKDQYLELN
ncbi:MAG: LPS export ABC transporter periplasmic protein LptC [Rickettsiales bacterium]